MIFYSTFWDDCRILISLLCRVIPKQLICWDWVPCFVFFCIFILIPSFRFMQLLMYRTVSSSLLPLCPLSIRCYSNCDLLIWNVLLVRFVNFTKLLSGCVDQLILTHSTSTIQPPLLQYIWLYSYFAIDYILQIKK